MDSTIPPATTITRFQFRLWHKRTQGFAVRDAVEEPCKQKVRRIQRSELSKGNFQLPPAKWNVFWVKKWTQNTWVESKKSWHFLRIMVWSHVIGSFVNSSFAHSWISWRNCEQNLLSVALPLTKRLANQQYICASLHLIAKLREVVQEGAIEEQGVHWMPQLSEMQTALLINDDLACKDSSDVWCDLVHLFIPSHTPQKTAKNMLTSLASGRTLGK